MWCSAGPDNFNNELTALRTAITTYGTAFTSLVVGISVGSEDLYRISPTGRAHNSGAGADAATIAGYIRRVREALKGTALEKIPIGHVDTWTEWVDLPANQAVLDAVDWVGVDAYSYWQSQVSNAVGEGKKLFDQAMEQTKAKVGGKRVWVTETGFPVSGDVSGQAVPSVEGAKRFWDEVGCPLFGKVDVWWYILRDATRGTPTPSFGIVGADLGQPLFDISCKGGVEEEDAGEEACDAV
jgi:glucan endo-1,3-beta-D-glucosidase